jgi:hypothetical protein
MEYFTEEELAGDFTKTIWEELQLERWLKEQKAHIVI